MQIRYDVGMVTTHLSPALGFGGVAVSGARLAAAWAGVSSRKIALCSSDASKDGVIHSEEVRLDSNVNLWLYHAFGFKRWGFGLGAIPRLITLCKQSQAIYLNGIATWPTTLGAIICCFFKRPFIVAPRGGLLPEHVQHIRRHKPWKWIFYKLITFPTLRKVKAIHCTGKNEANGARSLLGEKLPVLILPNGVPLPQVPSTVPPLIEEKLVLSYVGRISHEKGINTFLRGWLRARRLGDRFLVAGSASGMSGTVYFKEFQEIVSQSDGAIEYKGYLGSSEVNKLIETSHFLVLPSGLDGDVRENFGIAVAEAMSLSRPVIVCKGLEWDDIEIQEAGFLFDRHPDAAVEVVYRAIKTTKKEWVCMAENARHYAEHRLDIRVTAEQVWRAIVGAVAQQ